MDMSIHRREFSQISASQLIISILMLLANSAALALLPACLLAYAVLDL